MEDKEIYKGLTIKIDADTSGLEQKLDRIKDKAAAVNEELEKTAKLLSAK